MPVKAGGSNATGAGDFRSPGAGRVRHREPGRYGAGQPVTVEPDP